MLERLCSDRLPRSSWHRGLAGGLEGMICLPSSFAPAPRERWQLQALPREMPCITNCCRFQAVRKGIPLLAAPTHCRVSVIALAPVVQGEHEQRLLAQNITRAWVKKDQNQRGFFSRPLGATNARDEFLTRVAEPLGLRQGDVEGFVRAGAALQYPLGGNCSLLIACVGNATSGR